MAAGSGFVENVLDLLAPWGGVAARRMFGGYGLYRQGTMFALVADDVLYLKADERNRPDFQDAGMAPFTYAGRKGPTAMSYYEAPPELFDDGEAMIGWAKRALGAALRARRLAKSPVGHRKSTGRNITAI